MKPQVRGLASRIMQGFALLPNTGVPGSLR